MRRTLLVMAALSAGALTALSPAWAQPFPSKPIEWVVPYPAGGGTDVVARTLADVMAKSLGQPIVVLNKPGAGTNIGADYLAKARPDGHTLMSADTATLAANPHLYGKLPYSAERDLAPVGLTVRFPLILVVHPDIPARTLAEFNAWAKAQPSANFASPGPGSPHHLAAELFAHRSGLKLTHVPYRGAAPALQDVAGGQVPFMFADTAAAYPFLSSGKLRAIGVASAVRVAQFHTIPTLDEQGMKGFEAYAWQGLAVPAGTPADAIARLNAALRAGMATTAVKARLQVLGLEAITSSPQQMADYAAAERAKWGAVIKAAGIRLD